MKSIPDHVLKNAVVIVPRKRGLKGIVDLNFALMGMLAAVAAAGCVFLALCYAKRRRFLEYYLGSVVGRAREAARPIPTRIA